MFKTEKKGKPKRQRKDSIPKPNDLKKKSVGGEAPQLGSYFKIKRNIFFSILIVFILI